MNCKSYIPGYYTTRGLNKDRVNSWPIYYGNKLLNAHLHNNCMFSDLNGYSEYDKEMLKRTMLEHEAIFRKQVYELHRLYRIQKDLMEEFQKNDLYRFSAWAVKSKSCLSSSESQPQVTGQIWKMYNQPALSGSQSRETTTVTSTNVSPISTLWSHFGMLENGAASFRESTKRIFDLQVPADVYTGVKGIDRSEITGFSSATKAPFSRKCDGDLENEVKLTLANVISDGGAHKYDSHRKNGLFHCFTDLNEPIEDTSLMGNVYSFLGEAGESKFEPNLEIRNTSHQNAHSVFQPDVSYSNLNLKLRESGSFDIGDGVAAPKNKATSEMVGDCENVSKELSWLENKPNCNESLNLNRLSSKVDLCFRNEVEVEIETPLTSWKLEDFPSNMHYSEEKRRRYKALDCSSEEKIIEPYILDKIQPNLNFLNDQQVDESQHGSFKNHIDLNREVTLIDEPNISIITEESQDFLPFSSFKASPMIDMDAPAIPLEENNTSETEPTPFIIRNDSQQNGCFHDMLIEVAAENMITLSIDKFEHLDDDQSCSATEPPCNTLHWFADIALLNLHANNSDIERDHFELMTLQLEEMKPEDTWRGAPQTENAKNDGKNIALLLFKKPRRGQTRKRRQRRDFQKDTLPGLSSLSRKEIVEDLQLIGGLMKASGCHWENGMPAKAKRRQLLRKTSIDETKEHTIPQKTLFLFSKNANNSEFVFDRPGMAGWGRTTRRCRRPRCHPQNITAALT